MKKLLLVCALIPAACSFSFSQKVITGMTSSGGGFGYGSTYAYDPVTGIDSLLFSFGGNGNTILLGAPHGNVIQATNGKLYGMAPGGGNFNGGGIFCYNPVTGKDSIVYSFNPNTEGFQPYGSLIQASNGLLYGMTSSNGGIISFDPSTNKESNVYAFSYVQGTSSYGALIQATNGLLYGVTQFGGANGMGTLFSYNISTGQDSVYLSFSDSTGGSPQGSLIQASNGLMYGLASGGGRYSLGTMFCFNPVTGTDSVLIHFNDSTGYSPEGSLLQAANGLLYGTASFGGRDDNGTIFAYNIAKGTDSVVVQINGTNGQYPMGSLIQAKDSLLYGTTWLGGANSDGIIFSYNTKTGYDSVLVNLSGLANGDSPYGDVLQASDGYMYGMTSKGGTVGAGVLYRLNPVTLQVTALYNFGNTQYLTQNSLIVDSAGIMYGMTYAGGKYDLGTLFNYNPATGKDSILINFDGSIASNPNGALVRANNGLLFGTSTNEGAGGSIFSYNPVTGKDSLWFTFNGTDGNDPDGSLILGSNGLLYGTTFYGGSSNWGTLFSFNPVTGAENVLVNFNNTNGAGPNGTPTEVGGIIYGTTGGGGYNTVGMLYSYNTATSVFDTLTSLGWGGGNAWGNVIADTIRHLLYWGSYNGGNSGAGALMSYNLVTKATDTLINFTGPNGNLPTGLLMWDTAANLIYSTTYYGGTYNYGVLYRYNPATKSDSTLFSFHDSLALAHRPGRHGKAGYSGALGVNPCGVLLTNNKGIPTETKQLRISNEQLKVYPNPTTGIVNFVIANGEKQSQLEVYNALGEKIYNSALRQAQGDLQIDLSNEPNGIYLYRITDNKGSLLKSGKLIIQK